MASKKYAEIFAYLDQLSTEELEEIIRAHEAFDQNHFPKEQVPQWYPEGFVMGAPELV